MKNKFLLLSIAVISAMSIFSCKDEEETKTAAPSIVGTWEVKNVNFKVYIQGTKFVDTLVKPTAGASQIAILKEDKTILRIGTEDGVSDTVSGTYTVTGSKLILNLVDSNGPLTEEYEDLTFNATDMSFSSYDPNKTDPDREEFTVNLKRK
jgi:hypothetical protein